jgi:Methylamine utilisation protein MauE
MLALDHPDAVIAIRTLIALVFLSAAIGKMRNWPIFQGVVANYRLLPQVLVGPVTYVLPPAEAAIGAILPTGQLAPWAEGAAALLLVAFAVAMGINLLRGRRHIDCGCFQGTLKQPLRWTLVSRNALLALLLAAAGAAPSGRPDGWTVVNGLLAGGALFVVLQSLNALWAVIPAARRPRQPGIQMEGTS